MIRPLHICVFLPVTILASLCTDAQPITKYVCIGDSVRVFQNIASPGFSETIALYKKVADKEMAIAVLSRTNYMVAGDKYNQKLSLENGNILIRDFQTSDEAIYVILYDDYTRRKELQICATVPPSKHCKPIIKLVDTRLFASVPSQHCGKPNPSVYFLGYNNQDVIPLSPEKEQDVYYACLDGPFLRCAKRSKFLDYCSSFRVRASDELKPMIYIAQRKTADVSIVLECYLNGRSAETFRWKRNGFQIVNDVKYSPKNSYLSIRYLKPDDQYDMYTCTETGSRAESDPYSIDASGPTFIKVKQNIMAVKEHDELNVSCISDCYPLCSVQWTKLDPFSGQKKDLLEADVLQIPDVARTMSGNYTCKVHNLITGEFLESSLSLEVLYGPGDILFNTSSKIIEVNEFDSVTILCTAECSPACMIGWTETSTGNHMGTSQLNLVNVTTNGNYTCRATNTNIANAILSETINIKVIIDKTLIPTIDIVRHHVSDSSLVLQCRSSRKSTGMFSWSVNGISIKNSDKYSRNNFFLTVRYLRAEDQNNSYTCREPGTKLRSNPFWIKIYGPTFIKINPANVVVKEHEELNVSCHADCYPLCSLRWFKFNTSSGQKNILSDENILQITDITRDTSGSYTCKVQNIVTGAFHESNLSLKVLYGPDDILFNATNNIIEVDEFDSITILCTAECFPSCLIGWTEMHTETISYGVDLKLSNVKMDGSYTCHATNPNITNATLSETIIMKVKFDVTLIPRIEIVQVNATDSSIVLQCVSSRVSKGQLSWRVNGSVITNRGRYSEDNLFLFVRHLTAEDQYNFYTCTESISGFQSQPFLIKIYGPHLVVLNTSETKTEVSQFSLITVVCFADCFPPCLLRWTSSYTDTVIEGAELTLVNVTSNGSLTCHATNPTNKNATVSETIDIMVKSDIHQTTWSTDQGQGLEDTGQHIPTIDYLVYVITGIGVIWLIVGGGFCFLKKNSHCHDVVRVSTINQMAHSDTSDSNQEETLSQHYWTIGTNTRGELSTVLEGDINVELVEFIERSHTDLMQSEESINASHQIPPEDDAYLRPLSSDPTGMPTSNSDYVEEYIDCITSNPMRVNKYLDLLPSDAKEWKECIPPVPSDPVDLGGYIDPILSDENRRNDYLDLLLSDAVECNEYIHPITSDSVDTDGYTDPIPSDPVSRNQYIDIIPSDAVECNDYIHPIPSGSLDLASYIEHPASDPTRLNASLDLNPSGPVECNQYIHHIPSDPVDLDGHADPTPSESRGRNRLIDSIPSLPIEQDGHIDNILSANMESDRCFDIITSDPVKIDV